MDQFLSGMGGMGGMGRVSPAVSVGIRNQRIVLALAIPRITLFRSVYMC